MVLQKVKKIESPWSAKAKNQTVQGELLSQYNIQVHFVAPSYKRSLVQQNCMRVLNTEGTLKAYYSNFKKITYCIFFMNFSDNDEERRRHSWPITRDNRPRKSLIPRNLRKIRLANFPTSFLNFYWYKMTVWLEMTYSSSIGVLNKCLFR